MHLTHAWKFANVPQPFSNFYVLLFKYNIMNKSSPVPVLFIPLKNSVEKCNYCGIKYSKTDTVYCKNFILVY
jgi:hypothetical protein